MRQPNRFQPHAEPLDVRIVPAANPLSDGTFAVAPSSESSLVRVFNRDGSERFRFLAYDAGYTGPTLVATGDVTGDRVEDIVTSTGPGGSANIRVFNGANGTLINSFYAYPPEFTGGANVAVGDIDGDGFGEVVVGAGVGGGPNVRVFEGRRLLSGVPALSFLSQGGMLLSSFYAYDPAFTGGVRVAMGDVNGDRFGDIITGVGSGGGPNVRVLGGRQLLTGNTSLAPASAGGALLNSFFALPEAFMGGVFVGTGDVNNDARADVLVGVGSGGGPHLRAFDGLSTGELASVFAFDEGLTGGLRVAGSDINQDGYDDYVVGTGPGSDGRVRVLSGRDGGVSPLLPEFSPFGGYEGGVNVG